MNAIKAILAAIMSFAEVLQTIGQAANKGAKSLDNLATLGEVKSENYVKLVKLRDHEEFMRQQDEINKLRAKRNADAVAIQSTQALAEDDKDVFGNAFAEPPKKS